jgi:hypothetical protein
MISNQQLPRQKTGLVFGSLIIGLSFIVCAALLGHTIVEVRGRGQTISVTGAAFKPIVSDYALWKGWVNVTAPTLDGAYAELKADMVTAEQFLKKEGFSVDDFEIGTVSISKTFNRDREVTGYRLRQNINMEMNDVERLTQLARKSSTLIEKGVEFETGSPRYLFTGLHSLKIEMIKAATENAKLRADQLAASTGRKVGAPISARVGVFQIRPLHSQEVSDYGINDQSSIDKEIVCTVHINFLIE